MNNIGEKNNIIMDFKILQSMGWRPYYDNVCPSENKEDELTKAKKDLTETSWLHQQYDSPHCWPTVEVALREFGKLKSKAARLRNVKE